MPDVATRGLTSAEVAERVRDGRTNDLPARSGRSTWDIVRANVFTRINAILGVLLAIVLTTGSLINAAFGLLIFFNSIIGIVQELRAKRTLDSLAVVGEAKPTVRRDGQGIEVSRTEVVADDIIEIGPGDQLIVDGEVDRGALPGDRRVAAHRRGRPGRQDARRRGDERQLRRRRVGRVPGHQGRPGGVCRAAGRGGQQVHAGRLRAARRDQPDPHRRHLAARAGRPADHLDPAVPHQHDAARGHPRHGCGAGADGARGPGPADLASRSPSGWSGWAGASAWCRSCRPSRGWPGVDVVCADKTGTLTENGMRLAEVDRSGWRRYAGRSSRRRPHRGPRPARRHRGAPQRQHPGDQRAHPPRERALARDAHTRRSRRRASGRGSTFDGHGSWLLGAPDVLRPRRRRGQRHAPRAAGATGLRVLLLASGRRPGHWDAADRRSPPEGAGRARAAHPAGRQ